MGRGFDRDLLPGLLRSRRWRRWAFWTLATVLWAWFLLGEEGLLRQVARWREVRALEARLAAVRARNDALRQEIRELREDDLAIEAAVRRELDWQRPGERVFVLSDDDPLERPAGGEVREKLTPGGGLPRMRTAVGDGGRERQRMTRGGAVR